MPRRAPLLLLFLLLGGSPGPAGAVAPPVREVVLVDTDIGDEIDDALALAVLLSSPHLDVRGVTTVHGDAWTRAMVVCRLLEAIGRTDIPVASGQPARAVPDSANQLQYGLRPSRTRPVRDDAVAFLHRQLQASPGRITLLAIGPLTNIAALLSRHPECRPWIRRIVLMGGALHVGYNGKPPAVAEYNIRKDIAAARTVLGSGVPLVVVPLDVTCRLELNRARVRRILGHGSALTDQLDALFALWVGQVPILFDPLAALLCADADCCQLQPMRLSVDAAGITHVVPGVANARVAVKVDEPRVFRELVEWLTADPALKPVPHRPTNRSKPIPRGGFPARVHVTENYETDIERRWWLVGAVESQGMGRVCRGVLTADFDQRAGENRGLYTAVIFNPVPGPPMGPNTRLSFRCWLRGSDSLRVQIYSLSKGYHRHLTLTDLPQGRWLDLTVDMTQARRPDGSGGPLAADERIDDIQFYTARQAELRIADIVLYDEAPAGEKRPFPKRILFTGWFDTGKQGAEWPGSFAIVPHRPPLTWKAARSVLDVDTKRPWIRIDLRGPRPGAGKLEVRFRYLLRKGRSIEVEASDGRRINRPLLLDAVQDAWTERTIPLDPGDLRAIRELRFRVPAGAALEVDDVLIYEPGKGS